MKKNYYAPIYDIITVTNKLVYAKGNEIHYNNEIYTSFYNIHRLKTFDEYIFGLGKYTICAINLTTKIQTECKTNTWIGDVIKINNLLQVYTLRGESFLLDLNNFNKDTNTSFVIDKRQNEYVNCHKTYTALCVYKQDAIKGMWNGYITYKTKDYKIHSGAIFDICVYKENIITCSADRSVCILDKNFTILHQIYDYRSRIYKCGFITDLCFAQRLLQECKLVEKDSTIKLLFYVLTECGNLKVYCNKTIIYEYKDLDVDITSVLFYNNNLYLGYNSGTLEEKKVTFSVYQGKSDLFYIKDNTFVRYHNKKIENIDVDVKVTKLYVTATNDLYFTSYKTLYKVCDNSFTLIHKFDDKIVNLYNNYIILPKYILYTTPCYTNIIAKYNSKDITACYHNFFGTRKGFLVYKNIQFKISDDAITGICEKDTSMFLSCRDGYVYIINTNYVNKLINEHIDQIITIEIQTMKKYISAHFLEGIFVNNDIFVYYFANNCLVVATFFAKQCYKIGFRPKRYVVTKDKFVFIKNDDLYTMKLEQKKQKVANNFTHGCYNNKNKIMCLVTPCHIFLYKNNLFTDRLEIHEVSVIKIFEEKILVGTLKGKLYVCEVYENMIVEKSVIYTDDRIIDIIADNVENGMKITCLLGNKSIFFAFFIGDELKHLSNLQCNYLYTAMCLRSDATIFLARNDGMIQKYETKHEIITDYRICSTMLIHKIVYIDDSDCFIGIGDDHTLMIIDDTQKVKKIFGHTGPIVDFVFIDKTFLLTISTDKTLCLINYQNHKVKKTMKINIYKPAFMIKKDDTISVYGCGSETFSISDIMENIQT